MCITYKYIVYIFTIYDYRFWFNRILDPEKKPIGQKWFLINNFFENKLYIFFTRKIYWKTKFDFYFKFLNVWVIKFEFKKIYIISIDFWGNYFVSNFLKLVL